MTAAEQLLIARRLRSDTNPFAPGVSSPRNGRSLQTALGEVIRHIGLESPIVVVAGNDGTGKSLLSEMTARACTRMGLAVRQFHHGDLIDTSSQPPDVLLVDDADLILASTLRDLITQGKAGVTTAVFFCRTSALVRFRQYGVLPAVVELRAMAAPDARSYLVERAASMGRPDLFTSEALDLIVYGARGSLQSLRTIANLAFENAMLDQAGQISLKHVGYVLASQLSSRPEETETAEPQTDRHEEPDQHAIEAAPVSQDVQTPTVIQETASLYPHDLPRPIDDLLSRFITAFAVVMAAIAFIGAVSAFFSGNSGVGFLPPNHAVHLGSPPLVFRAIADAGTIPTQAVDVHGRSMSLVSWPATATAGRPDQDGVVSARRRAPAGSPGRTELLDARP